MNEIALSDIEKAGSYIARSGLFGVKKPEEAIALMLVAQSEGRNPFEAARDYHIIQGRPALKADAVLTRFQQAGGKVEWIEYTDTKVVGKFSHPQGGSVTIDWTMERAKQAGLTGKDNWRNYPRAMLRARCISEGVRTVYPGVASGIYTVEEVQDMAPEPVRAETPMEVVQAPDQKTVIDESTLDKIKRICEARGISDESKKALNRKHAGNLSAILAELESEPVTDADEKEMDLF